MSETEKHCIASRWHVTAPSDQDEFPPEDVFAAGMRNHNISNTAYPIHHTTTMRDYRVARDEKEQYATQPWSDCREMSIYAHIPFCHARCTYCEYVVVDPLEAKKNEDMYFEYLLREIEQYYTGISTKEKLLVGFDIGGGTPSFAKTEHIQKLVDAVKFCFQIKTGMTISIETTPVIAANDPEKLYAYKGMGIDRISMGLQTTQATLAQAMNREYPGIHLIKRAVRNIREAGFDRFNIDLMYGFAQQSLDGWKTTVMQTIDLYPEYITLYRMRYKSTKIKDQATQVNLEDVWKMEQTSHEMLVNAGYAGSPGKNTYSRVAGDVGTSDYLTERVIKGTPYLGVGLGAQTMSPYTLSYNLGAATKTLPSYFQAIDEKRLPIQDIYHLSLEAAIAKMISVSFYFGQIHLDYFREKFGISLQEKFPKELEFLIKHHYMEMDGSCIRLTQEGNKYYNGVIALFYSGAVKQYLINLHQ